ncbi:hypothetical protein SK128_022528 [Halocaridina rubra]|uniref:Uncharacterized protein n=1 Tax=Halocaridina rubra TaxID=373956 RepID=A0AAN8WLT9_HALRR
MAHQMTNKDIVIVKDWSRTLWPYISVLLAEELSMSLESLGRSVLNLPTLKCNTGSTVQHLSLDQACLEVSNEDKDIPLELWAQSKECYKCSPWKFLSLAANVSSNMVVNTTYPTYLYLKNSNGTNVNE